MRNLFFQTHQLRHGSGDNRLGSGWEDTVTDALAFYLATDKIALERFAALLIGPDATEVVGVTTQHTDGAERPDMAFTLSDGGILLVENKTGAALQPRQLQRYLDIQDARGRGAKVALIAMRPRTVPPEVLRHKCYLRPSTADHYLWQDVYRCIPAGGPGLGLDALRDAMRTYMATLGLAPSSLHGRWTELYAPRSEATKEVMKEFGRKLRTVRSHMEQMGLRVTAVSYMGLQGAVSGMGALAHLTVIPATPNLQFKTWPDHDLTEALRVALTWDSDAPMRPAQDLFERFPRPLLGPGGHAWWPTRPYRFSTNRVRLDFVTAMKPLLEDEHNVERAVTAACEDVLRWIDHEVLGRA
jgi:hypothetical protein